ncbi:MAG: response regulator [Ignavibacteriae bacterium]|nr:response regulator [Ignavibacteriota bacterium]
MTNNHDAKILIVDDEPSNVELLESMLIKEGYVSYKSLTDPRHVVPTYKEWLPDLILLDIMMPHMDGFAVMEELKQLIPHDDYIPLLVLTADTNVETKKTALAKGAMDFITKPFNIIEVMLRVKNLLHTREIHRQLQNQNVILEERVRERTYELIESQERLLNIINGLGEGLIVSDLNDVILDVNSTLLKMTGYTHEELIGQTAYKVFMPHDTQERMERRLRNRSNGEVEHYEEQIRRKDGSVFWVRIIGSPLYDTDGKIIGSIGANLDMTEQKRMEEERLAVAQRNTMLVQALGEVVYEWHPIDNIVHWEGDYTRILGYTGEELGNTTDAWESKIHPDDKAKVWKAIDDARAQQRSIFHSEYRILHKNGDYHWMQDRGVMYVNAEGKLERLIGVFRDISEQKTLETKMLRSQRMESIGTLAGGIAHDLNNVLSPIMLALEILSKKLPDEHSQKMLQMIQANIKRGADLIKQVLSFARGVEGKHTIVQIRHLIDEMGKTINETFPKSIQFYTDVPKNLPTITADATQIHQVLMNLCVNARDAMQNGGIIEIKAETLHLDEQYVLMNVDAKPGRFVVVTVSDQGTGIPPALLERIFEPFFTTKEVGKGTGLGLSTVLAIVKSHNGFVNVYSEVGKGTTFKVYLPANNGEVSAVSEEKELLPMGNGELILVVDDEAGIREVTKATLEVHGYRVILASDGTQAVTAYAIHREQIALVITDMLMPFMDGPTTIRALQNMNPKIKILAVSGLKEDGYNFNHDLIVFLHKPYTSEKLLRTVKEMLTKG